MLARLRENALLKAISVIASIMLWVYVQAEGHPVSKISVFAKVMPKNAPPGADMEHIPQQIPVNLSGPPIALQQIKDGDIVANLDLRNVQPDREGAIAVHPQIILPPDAIRHNVNFENPPVVRFQVHPRDQSQMTVSPVYPDDPPAGFRYGRPDIRPHVVNVSGQAENLSLIDKVVIFASPLEPGAGIDGDFPVQIRDKDNNPVEGVRVDPEKVHLTVPLDQEPAAKIVTVSPTITDQPLPPYFLQSVVVKPNQVRITGRPERLNQLTTLPTEDISIRDDTGAVAREAELLIPTDIAVRDIATGERLHSVRVTISLRKDSPPPAPPAPSAMRKPAPSIIPGPPPTKVPDPAPTKPN